MPNETYAAKSHTEMLIRLIDQYMELIRLSADTRGITKGTSIQTNCLKLMGKLGAFYYEMYCCAQGKHISELGNVLLGGTIMAHQLGYSITAKTILDYRDTLGLSNACITGHLCAVVSEGTDKLTIFYRLLDVIYKACGHLRSSCNPTTLETLECVENALALASTKMKEWEV